MEVGFLKVYHPFPIFCLDIRISDIPFLGDSPIEDLRSGRDLMHLDFRHNIFQHLQRLAETISRNAPADGEHAASQLVHYTTVILHSLIFLS